MTDFTEEQGKLIIKKILDATKANEITWEGTTSGWFGRSGPYKTKYKGFDICLQYERSTNIDFPLPWSSSYEPRKFTRELVINNKHITPPEDSAELLEHLVIAQIERNEELAEKAKEEADKAEIELIIKELC